MRVFALVVAAGSGSRMLSAGENKAFLTLAGRPLVFYALKTMCDAPLVDQVILVVKASHMERARCIVDEYGLSKVAPIVAGGDTRTASVRNGLASIKALDDDIVLIHDGARPFLTGAMVDNAANTARLSGAAVVGVPCTATIKEVTDTRSIQKTPDRKYLWEAQTPQAFRYGILKEAYDSFAAENATDDSVLVERLGQAVIMVPGDRTNIKVTVPEDLMIAEAILKMRQETAGGQ
ncbi:MAG: 2-C-methyl-D-erythritol 4-phosphate cytidylyltransferase [Candidatus Omnitrophica bacterium]|nr:2-C-methyl-D-erythritol 4-phosphate cytidylyltransferase [Candidatus Omnitrophota bacterium]MDD4013610.1 2-C-methyl-D-erythritol 4-phosphate cytidylyltransferase [Candidatus Omnitrophota bacterium]